MVPSTYEDGTLYNVLPSGNKAPDETGNHNGYDQTRADFSFSRGSNLSATRINSDGLIEKGRENLLLQSNSFDTSPFSKNSNISLTSGQSGYDGSNDAWLVSKDTSTQYLWLSQSLSQSGVQTASLYAKEGTISIIALYGIGGTNPYVEFDLSTGVVVAQRSSVIDSSITSVGNGWYRLTMTFNESITAFNIYPDWDLTNTGNLYIQNAQLEKGLVSTPYIETGSTTAQAGILEDMPRINYDANGENGALLLEPSRTNLLAYSEYYDAGQWANTDVNLTTNYALSPEGKMNASLWEFTTTNTLARIQYVLGGVTIGATYTQSYYIKSLSGDLTLRIGTSGAIVGEFEDITATSEWQRFDFTSVASGTTEYPRIQNISGTQGAQILVYGAQMEVGSYVSSYIPTHGAAVTRGADVPNATSVSNVIGQSEGTIVIDFKRTFKNDNYNRYLIVDNNHSSNYQTGIFILPEPSNDGRFYINVRNNSTSVFAHTVNDTTNENLKVAVAYKSGDIDYFVNGTKVNSSTTTFTFSHTLTRIAANGSNQENKQILLFKSKLTDAECVTLTTL